MTQENLSKDIEAEISFTFPMFTEGREQNSFKNHRIYFGFNDRASLIWQVRLWLDTDLVSLNNPGRVFVEFTEPESLSGKLAVGSEFIVWAGMDIGTGRIVKIIDLRKRADENSENIRVRQDSEIDLIMDFIKNLCGKPIHFKPFMSFCNRLKRFLSQEDEDWNWRQNHAVLIHRLNLHIQATFHRCPIFCLIKKPQYGFC